MSSVQTYKTEIISISFIPKLRNDSVWDRAGFGVWGRSV